MTEHISAIGQISDVEYSGKLNVSVGQGAKFALLLAMLEQDPLRRPKLLQEQPGEKVDSMDQLIESINHYPVTPLAARKQDWNKATQTKELIHNNMADANLWLCMHQQPLSLHDDVKRIDEQVIANCSLYTQNRLKDVKETELKVDETGLYEVLQTLNSIEDNAA